MSWISFKKNIRENLTLEQLASQACMSKSHFVRTFKQELGQTPVEFILSERLKLARYYLQIGGFQVKEVAVMSGFNSIGVFHSSLLSKNTVLLRNLFKMQ